MTELIYDVRKNKYLQKIIDERAQYFSEPLYVDGFGRYGTEEWWSNIEAVGLIEVLEGRITRTILSEKGSIPQFELNVNGKTYVFNAEGDDGIYPVGGEVKVFFVKNDSVFTKKAGGDVVVRVELLHEGSCT